MGCDADLLEYLSYNPITGLFTWIKKPGRGTAIGNTAGTLNGAGYIQITIKGKTHLAHRLAWFFIYGIWPERLDHKDRIKTNNRIANLREATQSQNAFHTKRNASKITGARGVNLEGSQYRASIYYQGKKINLGRHDTIQEAQAAYNTKAHELFPGYVVGED